jgi:D-glycero-D-manno-heptose 1,7-bisphosphate phosphatase
MAVKAAIFLDRDGTLIVDKHYLKNPEEIQWYEDTFFALKMMLDKGYDLFIVTNQSGIARGYFTQVQMELVHQKLLEQCAQVGINFKEIAFCPHEPKDQCLCRKPMPGMIHELLKKYDYYDLKHCWMVGDKDIDKECGERAGMQGALVRNGTVGSFDTLLSFACELTRRPE